ncbi:hypothetical protein PIB30_077506 [Stylosanthes scabra]|uniref:Uncharacterized protein n=1 Tax=Stylosanthes scabra TaxID=79078 RepID=A0ABU6TRZ7_9FABA|nr:hypothetical protein [Stylosanthes scabra]
MNQERIRYDQILQEAAAQQLREANKGKSREVVPDSEEEFVSSESEEWVCKTPHQRAVLIHSIIIGENINVEEIIADQIYKFVYKTDVSSSLPFPSIIAALCVDARIPTIPDDTLIPQDPPIIGVAMTRTRETRARNPRPARQATPPQQQP